MPVMLSTIGPRKPLRNSPKFSRTLSNETFCSVPLKLVELTKFQVRLKSAVIDGNWSFRKFAWFGSVMPKSPGTPSVRSRLMLAPPLSDAPTTWARLSPPPSSLKVSRLPPPTGSFRSMANVSPRLLAAWLSPSPSVSSCTLSRRMPSVPPMAKSRELRVRDDGDLVGRQGIEVDAIGTAHADAEVEREAESQFDRGIVRHGQPEPGQADVEADRHADGHVLAQDQVELDVVDLAVAVRIDGGHPDVVRRDVGTGVVAVLEDVQARGTEGLVQDLLHLVGGLRAAD